VQPVRRAALYKPCRKGAQPRKDEMAETILVITEQREGKLNRVSFETLAGAQALAKQTGWTVEAAVVGSNIASVAAEVAKTAVAKVYAIEGAALENYTPDGFVTALKKFLEVNKPKLILLPHTYQVRDFAPQLAASFGAALVSDAVGCKFEGGKLLFTRQMFQGKFAVDISLAGDGPWFASFQTGAYRGDQVEAGAAAAGVESVSATTGEIRTHPEAPFREAKQAVDLTQAEIIVSVGRGIKEQKNIAIAQALADALGGEIAASRPICDAGWLPMERQVGSSGQTVSPKLYLALGISGAIQHLVGMKGSKNIIAVNKDAEAPIFEIADVAVVGNLFDIVPALTEEVKKAKA
jgi:electron transfer flavoprotein alpha subunit